MIDRLGKFMAAAALFVACYGAAAAADSPFTSSKALDSHIQSHQGDLERRLAAYNRKHRIAVAGDSRGKLKILSWDIEGWAGDQALVSLGFEVDDLGNATLGKALFELRWDGDSIEIAGHRRAARDGEVQAAASSGAEASPPIVSFDGVAAYLERSKDDLEQRLAAYNKRHRYAVPDEPDWGVRIASWAIERLAGDRVHATINFVLEDSRGTPGAALFELHWQDGELQFVGHRKPPRKSARAGGWLETGDDLCVHNYYAPRPCSGVVRQWTEFAETHGLALDPGSAAIYQSYKHSDFATGDRLMAQARGLPDQEGRSVFGLQAEVRAMNLNRYQGNAEAGCDLNPLAPKPCIEILPIYQEFVRRHGLAEDAGSATMFEAYAQGNYKKADVIYALAKGLDVPAYGFIPTGAAREVAKLWPRLNLLLGEGIRAVPCSANPYMPENDRYKPCPEILTMWREFAERYQLDDNAENANIFAQYAAGEYQAGDQLLAQAKGVSLEQLLEASGVPTGGLVIEVYPGTPQRMGLGRMGS